MWLPPTTANPSANIKNVLSFPTAHFLMCIHCNDFLHSEKMQFPEKVQALDIAFCQNSVYNNSVWKGKE
jgi:hypothetical protein